MAERRSENQLDYFCETSIVNPYWEVIRREPSKRNPKPLFCADKPADQERQFDYS
jgi:hypothetical protein